MLLVSALAGYGITTRLRLDPNVAALLPEKGESAALRRYLRSFGGSDLAMVLVRTKDASAPHATAEVEEAARELTKRLGALDVVRVASDRVESSGKLDPMLAWRHGDAKTRARLAEAMSEDGMRQRLKGSRAILVATVGGAANERIETDPLRLSQLLYEGGQGSGFRTQADGTFANDDGTARLVLVFPEGQALRGADAKAFVYQAREVIATVGAEHPSVDVGLTGGHAIAEATERMLTRDLTLSSTVSLLLAALAFVLTFRRMRALLAVMPPLALGTLWTAGVAATFPSGLSAIAVAFMSVVIGVGVDTGVHVYAALLEARREGLAPAEAARRARQRTQRPVLVAAGTAAVAFGALMLSEIGAVRQLGILCAGGEVLTAIAIVVVTPEIGARLERGDPPAERPPLWPRLVDWMTKSRGRALLIGALAMFPLGALALGYGPPIADAIIAVRPGTLEPLQVQQQVYDAFGGRPGQWVIMVADDDRDTARARADAIAERLGEMPDDVDAVDALTVLAPAPVTQRRRLAERDALDMAARADDLEDALEDLDFNVARFDKALAGMRKPSTEVVDLDELLAGDAEIMVRRYLGQDEGQQMVVVYALVAPGSEEAVERAVHGVDPDAMLTGYSRLDRALRASLERDLPRVGLVAGLLVLVALILALRRPRDIALAALVVVVELAAVLALVRIFNVPLHAYDALVLPVLLGITVDEAMFLLYRARRERSASVDGVIRETLRHEGPPIVTTALTTAAGFGGLILCDFDGLRHLGMVGAIGSIVGLIVAVLLVPAGIRLMARSSRGA